MTLDAQHRRRQPQQRRSHTLVGAVVTAFEQLIERTQRLSDLSMRAIAQRAGVGVGSIYEYFGGQDALFAEFLSALTQRNFMSLAAFIESTHELPLSDAMTLIVDRMLDLYMKSPGRTRIAIAIIVHLGRAGYVVHERDRIASLVADRVLRAHGHLERAHVELTMRMALDAGMGILLAELWRPTPDVRATARALTEAIFVQLLRIPLWDRRDAGSPEVTTPEKSG